MGVSIYDRIVWPWHVMPLDFWSLAELNPLLVECLKRCFHSQRARNLVVQMERMVSE